MDTRTGKIYELEKGESLKDLAAKLGGVEKDFVALGKLPDIVCPKCCGTGVIRRGFFSKRFKPCDCTK
jgi:hypothetical protein